jgi:hypothetical protein
MAQLYYVHLAFDAVLAVADGQTLEEVVVEHTNSILRDTDQLELTFRREIHSVHDNMGDWDKRCIPYGDETKTIEEWLRGPE